eukprot:Skav223585  [mRNA]  locus=scaffold689:188752:193908:+ [translate_table: standard]
MPTRLLVTMTQSQWQLTGSKVQTAILVAAHVTCGTLTHLDTTSQQSGVISYHDSRRPKDDDQDIQMIELFAGGFSGWTHVAKTMQSYGINVKVNLALDRDANCAESYSKSHEVDKCFSPFHYTHEDPDDLFPCFILDDVFSPAWLHMTSNVKYDMLCMSPPCPPWSAVNEGKGSLREDGLFMYAAWKIVSMIRPMVIAMEMVSNLLQHREWPMVRRYIETRGYTIRWVEALDLAQVLPQHRDRLLLVATTNEDAFALCAHRCIKWPVLTPPTLRSHQILADLCLPWSMHVVPDADIMRMYLDPALMPGAKSNSPHVPKRVRKDLWDYRMRDMDSCFSCILTTYGHAHELDERLLQSGGLFGALLMDPRAVRFLQVPEILALFGPTNQVWLPGDVKRATRILGNCISVPHAAIAMVNCVAFLKDISMVEAAELFAKIMTQRMHAGNMKSIEQDGGFMFTLEPSQGIPPTMPMHTFAHVIFTNGYEGVSIQVEFDIRIADVLSILTGRTGNFEAALQPLRQPFLKVPLSANYSIQNFEVRIAVAMSFKLQMNPRSFMNRNGDHAVTMLLTSNKLYALHRTTEMTIADVEAIIQVMEQRTDHIYTMDSVGFIMAPSVPAPEAALILKRGLTGGPIDLFEDVRMYVEHDGIHWVASRHVINNVKGFLRSSGLDELLRAFGWIAMIPACFNESDQEHEIMLIPRRGSWRLSSDDLCHMLTLQFFLFQVGQRNLVHDHHTVLCRFRMYGMWIWRGEISLQCQLQIFRDMWQKASEMMQGPCGLRFLHHGNILQPHQPLRNHCMEDDMIVPVMDITLMTEQRGGGPVHLTPAPPLPPRSVRLDESHRRRDAEPISVDTHDIRAMEIQNFEQTQTQMFEQWHKMPRQLRDFPIEEFEELSFVMDDGMLMFNGPLKKLITFNKYIKASGMELILYQSGWLVVLQFVEFGDPPQGRLLIIPRPDRSGVSRAFARSLIQMCLISMDFPTSVPQSEDTCKVKVKLWSTIVYEGNVPRNIMCSDFFDAYERSSRVLGYMSQMRIILRGKQIMQEFPLRHYIHQNPEAVNTLHYVLQLRGGGGSQPADIWSAKHAVATTMVTAGADLKLIDAFVDQLTLIAGPTSMVECCKPASVTAKINNLRRLASKLKVPMPEISQQAFKLQNKIKDKIRADPTRYPTQELPKHLQIQEGFLLNADGTQCPQLNMVQPNSTGVVLLNWEDAMPWLLPPQKLSVDELGIIVLGQCHCQDASACVQLTIPVYSAPNNPMIVKGVLHQLGGKTIQVCNADDTKVPVSQTEIIAVTAFRDELGEGPWGELIQAPIKYCMSQLQLGDDKPMQLPSPPWGRSFQREKAKVEPSKAYSFQFHCRVPKGDVKKFLRASGFSGMYTTVKNENRQISQEYSVVWLQISIVEMQKLTVTYVDHRGIVRSAKPSATGRGLRFERDAFGAAWAKLRPNETEPDHLITKHMFKIAPTPVGATAAELTQFLQTAKWKAKPIRALNATTWLCAAEDRSGENFLTWNGSKLLIKWMEQKKNHEGVIIAGVAPKQNKPKDEDKPKDAPQMLLNDPWAPWAANRAQNSAFAIAAPSASASQPPRKIDAPLESRFKAQDDALEFLKQQSAEKISKLQDEMTQLQSNLQKTNEVVITHQKQTQHEFTSLRSETATQFTQMQNSFNASLKSSMHNHEKHVNSQFEELKQLLIASQSEADPSRKVPKLEHNKSDQVDDGMKEL